MKILIPILTSIMVLSLTACNESKEERIRTCACIDHELSLVTIHAQKPRKDYSIKEIYDCYKFIKNLSPKDQKTFNEISHEITKHENETAEKEKPFRKL